MSSDTVQQIKEKLSIVEVVSGYLKLEKAGVNFKARCPFHKEKTPSFSVSPSRNAYYCFGCGEKGDIFTFVERMEGLDFKGALKQLAERAGVPLRFERKESTDERERLFDLLEAATAYYQKNLAADEKVRGYLSGRGVAPGTIERFHIGYARPEWRGVIEYLEKKGFSRRELMAAGLAKEAEGSGGKRLYDRFRGRIMFPIRDGSARVVGFSGRHFEAMPVHVSGKAGASDGEAPREPAKYINSPETDLYQKSRILYGYDLAKTPMRKSDFAILVEGQMDLILSHQGGFPNTVALSGTALTKEHLAQIARMTKRLVLALDADAAGVKSAGRGAFAALQAGFDLKVAELPAGKDPADIVAGNPEDYRRVIRSSVHIIDFFLTLLSRDITESRSLIKNIEEKVLPYLAEIESPLDRAHFVKRVADVAQVPESAVLESLERVTRTPADLPEERQQEVEDKKPLRLERIMELLFGLWKWLGVSYQAAVTASKEKAKRELGERFDEFEGTMGERADALALMVESTHESEGAGLRHLDLLGTELEKLTLREELQSINEKLRAAEARRDSGDQAELLVRSQALGERLKRL